MSVIGVSDDQPILHTAIMGRHAAVDAVLDGRAGIGFELSAVVNSRPWKAAEESGLPGERAITVVDAHKAGSGMTSAGAHILVRLDTEGKPGVANQVVIGERFLQRLQDARLRAVDAAGVLGRTEAADIIDPHPFARSFDSHSDLYPKRIRHLVAISLYTG